MSLFKVNYLEYSIMENLHNAHSKSFPKPQDNGLISKEKANELRLKDETVFMVMQKLGMSLKNMLLDEKLLNFTFEDTLKVGMQLLE